jgi:hypothetical protein
MIKRGHLGWRPGGKPLDPEPGCWEHDQPTPPLLCLIPALQQGLCPLGKARRDRKVQGISEPIDDIEQRAHVHGLKHGLLTDPCRFHCCHICWLDGFGRERQLFQVAKHPLQLVVDGGRAPIRQDCLYHCVTRLPKCYRRDRAVLTGSELALIQA